MPRPPAERSCSWPEHVDEASDDAATRRSTLVHKGRGIFRRATHIFNYGAASPAGTLFNVAYIINAGAPVTELPALASNLQSNSALDYTVTTQANLTVAGNYTFSAAASLPGDVSPSNDAYVGYVVNNSIPSVGGTLAGPGAPSSSGTLTLTGSVGTIAQ